VSKYFDITRGQDTITFTCKDDWSLYTAHVLRKDFSQVLQKNMQIIFDFALLKKFDTHGILCYLDFIEELKSNGCKIETKNMSEKFLKLYEVCKVNYTKIPKRPEQLNLLNSFFYKIGLWSVQSKETMTNFFSFVGGITHSMKDLLLHPAKFRFKATLYQIQTSGVSALPIIFLTSFLIGIVIAFQGAVQLEKFGANIFIVEMVSISVTRELAPLITAIVIAGRSASSYTAQIGVMKITEEIDAMETMGFTSWQFLILPRVIGLMICLPLLVLFADAVAIFGGMVVSSSSLGISFEEFLLRMQESVELRHIYIGLLKAPIFGWIIAVIGCFRGFQISSSTESVGKYTTISVVNAIFWVIATDAIISVFLTEMDL